MIIQTIQLIHMNKQEYNQIKQELKRLFPFASVKRNKQAYSMGGFNIRPTKKINYSFNDIQTTLIMNWLVSKDFYVLDQTAEEYSKELCTDGQLLYKLSAKDGFSFICKYLKGGVN